MLMLLKVIGLRGFIGGAAGLIAGFLALSAYHTAIVHPSLVRAAVAEGQAIERKAWEAQMAIVRREMAKRLSEAQAKIDAAEQSYLESQSKAAAQILALEEIIVAEQESENAADNSCPARPAISKRMSIELDKIGR